MPRWAISILVAALLAVVAGTVALASGSDTGGRSLTGTRASVSAPNARMAALVDTAPTLLRNKGFVTVKNISPGQICLRVPTGIDARTVIAVVSAEWIHSADPDITAVWESDSSNCGRASRWVQVYTFKNFAFTNEAFSIIVP